jgi:hypothetical protein
MNLPTRLSAPPQTLQLYLYRRPLHPEGFTLKGRKHLTHAGYDLEAWLLPGGHVLSFHAGMLTCCELLTSAEDVPVEGAVTGFACTNEHEFSHRFGHERVGYTVNVQTETLSGNLYRMTYEDMLEYARQTDSLAHKWTDEAGRRHLSVLDLQKLPKEVHCQSFHLVGTTGLVIRTQTIFDCR